jgi:hypothetical protein
MAAARPTPLIFSSFRSVPPIQIPQSIASGILGHSSFSMGLPSALLGMALHFLKPSMADQ